MNKKAWFLVGTAALGALLIVAVLLYNALSDTYEPPTDGTSEPPTVTTTASADSAPDRTAPDFTVYDANGREVKLSDRLTNPTVINFWATWCGPCKSELPAFEELYEEYGDQVDFMMVNMTDDTRETPEVVKAFLAQNGYTFPVYYDTDYSATYAYGVYSIPLTVFIDRDGQILYSRPGAMSKAQIQLYLDQILDE